MHCCHCHCRRWSACCCCSHSHCRPWRTCCCCLHSHATNATTAQRRPTCILLGNLSHCRHSHATNATTAQRRPTCILLGNLSCCRHSHATTATTAQRRPTSILLGNLSGLGWLHRQLRWKPVQPAGGRAPLPCFNVPHKLLIDAAVGNHPWQRSNEVILGQTEDATKVGKVDVCNDKVGE